MTIAPGDAMHAPISEVVNDANVRRIGGSPVLRGDGPHRLERERDRCPVRAELHRRRIRRMHVGVHVQLAI
jgi:hypothetical protein